MRCKHGMLSGCAFCLGYDTTEKPKKGMPQWWMSEAKFFGGGQVIRGLKLGTSASYVALNNPPPLNRRAGSWGRRKLTP